MKSGVWKRKRLLLLQREQLCLEHPAHFDDKLKNLGCYGVVDNNRLQVYTGRVNFSGGQSWLKNPLAGIFKGK